MHVSLLVCSANIITAKLRQQIHGWLLGKLTETISITTLLRGESTAHATGFWSAQNLPSGYAKMEMEMEATSCG